MAASTTQRSGELLAGTYALEERVGGQASHEVYRARDQQHEAAVLVTLLSRDDGMLARARVLAELRHACLPQLTLETDERGRVFVVEELVEGRPLSDLIDAFPQGVPLALVGSVMCALLEALALVHAGGLAHGALDPTQIRLAGPLHAPTPKLIGLYAVEAPREQDPAYRAPRALDPPEPAEDVFASGVLLYHMLSGGLPFHAGQREAVPLQEVAPQLPAALAQLTAACLVEAPAQRLVDASVVLLRLRACCRASPSPAAPPSQRTGETQPSAAATAGLLRASAPVPRSLSARAARPDIGQTGAASPRARARAQHQPSLPVPERNPPVRVSERPAERAEQRVLRAQEAADKLSAKHSPRQSLSAPAGSARPSAKPRPQSALTPQQQAALAALRSSQPQEERDRWPAALFALLLLLFLVFGVPLFEDAALAAGRATFGPRLPLAAAACSVLALVGALHALVARSGALVQRLQGVVMLVVACCVCLVSAQLYFDTALLRRAAEHAARGLPWATAFSLSLFGLALLLRALREMAEDVLFAALVATLAVAGLLGAYGAVRSGLAHEHARAALLREAAPARPAAGPDAAAAEQAEVTPPQPQEAAPEPQRSELGANEQDDLAPVNGLDRARKSHGEALEQLRDKVSRSPTSVLTH